MEGRSEPRSSCSGAPVRCDQLTYTRSTIYRCSIGFSTPYYFFKSHIQRSAGVRIPKNHLRSLLRTTGSLGQTYTTARLFDFCLLSSSRTPHTFRFSLRQGSRRVATKFSAVQSPTSAWSPHKSSACLGKKRRIREPRLWYVFLVSLRSQSLAP